MTLQMNFSSRWLRLSLLNFGVAALAGAFLRYKVSYSFPVMEFKNLLHAHSHFAFAGWVSTGFFALLMNFFLDKEQQEKKIYRRLFLFSQLTSYGMLFSFLIQEYGPFSIAFSTLYVFVTYVFAWMLWKDTRQHKNSLPVIALRVSLVCLVVSSFGPYVLAGVIASHFMSSALYHNAIYWYLHFQYNGWFSFAVFAAAMQMLVQKYGMAFVNRLKPVLWLMIIACAPSFLLSVLWIAPPLWVFVIAGSAAFLQVIAYFLLVRFLRAEKSVLKFNLRKMDGALIGMAFFSVTIKILLQQLLVFPFLNEMVFGHRPVIIGYLHLVMLGFVSFAIIGMALARNILSVKKRIARISLLVFIAGVLLNEVCLLLRGLDDIFYISVPMLGFWLFVAAVLLFTGTMTFAFSQQQSRKNQPA